MDSVVRSMRIKKEFDDKLIAESKRLDRKVNGFIMHVLKEYFRKKDGEK